MGKRLSNDKHADEARKCKLYQFPSQTCLFSSMIDLQVQESKEKDHIDNTILSILVRSMRPCNFTFPSFRTAF